MKAKAKCTLAEGYAWMRCNPSAMNLEPAWGPIPNFDDCVDNVFLTKKKQVKDDLPNLSFTFNPSAYFYIPRST